MKSTPRALMMFHRSGQLAPFGQPLLGFAQRFLRRLDFKAIALGDEEFSQFSQGRRIGKQMSIALVVLLRYAAAESAQRRATLVLDPCVAEGLLEIQYRKAMIAQQ